MPKYYNWIFLKQKTLNNYLNLILYNQKFIKLGNQLFALHDPLHLLLLHYRHREYHPEHEYFYGIQQNLKAQLFLTQLVTPLFQSTIFIEL